MGTYIWSTYSRVRRKKVTTVNLDMEHRAERLASLFPEPEGDAELEYLRKTLA